MQTIFMDISSEHISNNINMTCYETSCKACLYISSIAVIIRHTLIFGIAGEFSYC